VYPLIPTEDRQAENQLELTDHDHRIKDVREKHRQAIDWLNEYQHENIGFYLVQIELWQMMGLLIRRSLKLFQNQTIGQRPSAFKLSAALDEYQALAARMRISH
jgi:hypothetical protein